MEKIVWKLGRSTWLNMKQSQVLPENWIYARKELAYCTKPASIHLYTRIQKRKNNMTKIVPIASFPPDSCQQFKTSPPWKTHHRLPCLHAVSSSKRLPLASHSTAFPALRRRWPSLCTGRLATWEYRLKGSECGRISMNQPKVRTKWLKSEQKLKVLIGAGLCGILLEWLIEISGIWESREDILWIQKHFDEWTISYESNSSKDAHSSCIILLLVGISSNKSIISLTFGSISSRWPRLRKLWLKHPMQLAFSCAIAAPVQGIISISLKKALLARAKLPKLLQCTHIMDGVI